MCKLRVSASCRNDCHLGIRDDGGELLICVKVPFGIVFIADIDATIFIIPFFRRQTHARAEKNFLR